MFQSTKRKTKTALFFLGAVLATRPAFLFAQDPETGATLQGFLDVAMKESQPRKNDSDLDKCLQRAVDDFKLKKDPDYAPEHIGKGSIQKGDVRMGCIISNDAIHNPNFPGVIINFVRHSTNLEIFAFHILPDGELYFSVSYNMKSEGLEMSTAKTLKEKVVNAYDRAIRKIPQPTQRYGRPNYQAPKN